MQLEQKSPEYYYETGWPVNIVNRLNISMGLYRRNSPMCNSDFYYVYILLGNHKRRKR